MQPRAIYANDAASSSANGVGSQKILTGTPTLGSTVPAMIANNPPVEDVIFSFSGTFSATAEVELSEDGGATWVGPASLTPVGGGNAVTTMNAPGVVSVAPGVATNARARCTAYSNGSMMVSILPGIPLALPDAPRLSFTPAPTAVLLQWQPVPGAVSYNVYSSTTSGTETLLSSGEAGPTYNNTGLTANTAHFYYVTAVNAAGESIASNEVSTKTLPTAPTSLGITAGTFTNALAWTAPSAGAATYNVYRGTAAGLESTTPIATGITAVSYTDTIPAMSVGTTYYYVVKAVNSAGGIGAASNEVSGATTGQAAPTSVLATAASPTTINLTWVAAAGAVTYNLYRGTATGKEAVAPVATKLTGTSYTDTGLTNGVTYYYKMTALGSVNQSAKSNESSATAGNTAPSAPTSVVATVEIGQVGLTWVDWTGSVTSRTVYRSLTTGTEASFVTGILVPSYVDQSCVPAVQYFYKVTDVNGIGESPRSLEVHGTVVAGNFPGTLTNSPTYTASVPTAISTFVTSLAFVGASSEYVTCGGTVANDLNQFTLCVRFKTSDSTHLTLIAARSTQGHQAWAMYNNSGSIGFVPNTAAGSNVTGVNSAGIYADGAWHDAIVVCDGINQTLKLYIDGTLADTGAAWSGTWNSNDLNSTLTWANKLVTSPAPFTGSLCDGRIYAELLGAGDIAAYHAGTPVSVSPVCWYKMNENTGSTALDSGVSSYIANVIFDGNSLTAGAHISDPNQFYYVRTAAMLAQITSASEAVSGQSTEDMIARYPGSVAPQFNGGFSKNLLVAWEGINSLAAGDTPAQAYAAMATYIGLAKATGWKVLVLTMIKCDPGTVSEVRRLAYNALVLANSGGADVVYDLAALPEFQDPTNQLYYWSDDIHLIAAGAAVVARAVMQQLVLM